MIRAALLACTVVLVAGACGPAVKAPVVGRETPSERRPAAPLPVIETPPGSYTVARGDTLYSIAWRYGLDYKDVARWNGIVNPYVIYPGQAIRLHVPPGASSTPAPAVSRTGKEAAGPTPLPQPPPAAPARSTTVPGAAGNAPVQWQWPTSGSVVQSRALTSQKGVDITGSRGQAISAAAAGSVVYSGSGLLGYGRLIIIKHNETFLSAYAHNETILVSEGDRVSTGQQIGTMGLGNGGQPVLHFEIRKDGKPINPLDHLPRKSS